MKEFACAVAVLAFVVLAMFGVQAWFYVEPERVRNAKLLRDGMTESEVVQLLGDDAFSGGAELLPFEERYRSWHVDQVIKYNWDSRGVRVVVGFRGGAATNFHYEVGFDD